MTDLLIRQARLLDGPVVDVGVADGRIVDVTAARVSVSEVDRVVDADGALLLPGLHDHHVHLLATAAAMESVRCGPPQVLTHRDFAAALQHAAATVPGDWIRAVGHHESVGGDLDRDILDTLVPDRPVRVQHRSGALWILNSAGLAALGVDAAPVPDAVERDTDGRATGRIWRGDRWLRDRLGPQPAPDVGHLGRHLAARGLTGVTDATPDLDSSSLTLLLDTVANGALPLRLCLLGVDELPADVPSEIRDRVTVGPRKVVLSDHDLPDLPTLVDEIRTARRTRRDDRRPVAVHCVTRVALVLLCAAFDEVGSVPGDRIEHASVVPADLLPTLRRLGVTVVTQPGLVAERGDEYLREIDPDDRDDLYRYASLLDAGIHVGLSTDAPYTDPDPWRAVDAATERRTPTGAIVGPRERVVRHTAINGFTTHADDPGGTPRRIAPGNPADLCLVDDDSKSPTVHLATVAGQVVSATNR